MAVNEERQWKRKRPSEYEIEREREKIRAEQATQDSSATSILVAFQMTDFPIRFMCSLAAHQITLPIWFILHENLMGVCYFINYTVRSRPLQLKCSYLP